MITLLNFHPLSFRYLWMIGKIHLELLYKQLLVHLCIYASSFPVADELNRGYMHTLHAYSS